MLAEIVRRPQPAPVLYVRCDGCGQVAPRTTVRIIGTWTSDDPAAVETSPPEYPCPLCGAYAPRVVGDQIDPDAPGVATVTTTCTSRFGGLQFWRRCDTTFAVPADASLVLCPACGHRYLGPSSRT